MLEFTLPSLGADMDQGKLLEWLVQPGEQVHKGQVVAVVDTSKAAIDVEIWHEATVHELLAEPGETIPVGGVMALLLAPGEPAPEHGARTAPPRRPRPTAVPPPVAAAGAPIAAAGAPIAAPSPAGGPARIAAESHVEVAGARRRISPAARKHAEELGVDLATLTGTGPLGAVTLADVDRAAAERAAAPAAGVPEVAEAPPSLVEPIGPVERQAQMRRTIAAAMSRSKREIPHYYLSETIPMARAVDWLTGWNAQRPINERMLMAVVQLKAVARALADHPDLNGHYVEGAFRPAAAAHIGVAISLRTGGLVAPALHDVGTKSLQVLMQELSDLVVRARAASLRSSELSDATITVTNLGDQGVESVFGIITPPQVALVGFGRVAARPWVADGALAVSQTVTASLAADHRVTDGHTGAMFLADLHDWLQRPEDL